jgi:hypothetical protein
MINKLKISTKMFAFSKNDVSKKYRTYLGLKHSFCEKKIFAPFALLLRRQNYSTPVVGSDGDGKNTSKTWCPDS